MRNDITIRLTEELRAFVEKEAERCRRPIASYVRNLIDDKLQESKLKHSPWHKLQSD